MPLDFEGVVCYVFHGFSSCDVRCKIENSGQRRQNMKKVVKMGENMKFYIKLTSEDDIKNITKMIDLMEDNEDVQNVWHNWEQ